MSIRPALPRRSSRRRWAECMSIDGAPEPPRGVPPQRILQAARRECGATLRHQRWAPAGRAGHTGSSGAGAASRIGRTSVR